MFFRLVIAVTAYVIMMTGSTAVPADVLSDPTSEQSAQYVENTDGQEEAFFSGMSVEENKEIELGAGEEFEIN